MRCCDGFAHPLPNTSPRGLTSSSMPPALTLSRAGRPICPGCARSPLVRSQCPKFVGLCPEPADLSCEPVDLCPEPVDLCPEPVEGRYGGSRCSARGGGSDIASAASSMSWSVPVMRPSCWRTCSSHEGTLNSSTNLLG